MEERQIGTTELRQRLTDVIQAVKEEKVAYVVETFGRPQVVIISLKVYRRLKDATLAGPATTELAQDAFGMWGNRDEIDDDWLKHSREQSQ